MIIFKLIGVYLGFYIAVFCRAPGLVGAVCGFIIGHTLDIATLHKIQSARSRRYWRARATAEANQQYITSIFQMIGRVSLADGKLKPEEIAAVDRIISEVFRLKRRDRKEAQRIFRTAGQARTTFQLDAAQFLEMHQHEPQALENMVLILLNVAISDGELTESEEQLVQTAARVFDLPENRYREILSLHAPTYFQRHYGSHQRAANGHAYSTNGTGGRTQSSRGQSGSEPSTPPPRTGDYFYSVLGCTRQDTVETIKQKYRKLVSDYHPDKIISKDLPEDFTEFATERFKAIQEAYEAIRTERGFR